MSYMSRVYADLVRKGAKTLEDVPAKLKSEVQQLLSQGEREDD